MMVDDGDLALRAAHTALLARGANVVYLKQDEPDDLIRLKETVSEQDLLLLPYRTFKEAFEAIQTALDLRDHMRLIVLARREEAEEARARIPERALLLARPFPLRQLLEAAQLS